MSADQVRALLGPPDDVVKESDPAVETSIPELWSYGADHHLGFATLGTVTFNKQNYVESLYGTKGADELAAQLGEAQLRRLLRILDRAACSNGYDFNPRETIAAVNALQPLGKKLGVAVLNEYLAVSYKASWDHGIIFVMEAVFEVPPASAAAPTTRPPEENPFIVVHPGYFRPPMIAVGSWEPKDPKDFPRFPLVIIDDIPLLPSFPLDSSGHSEHASEYLHYLTPEAQWRDRPLAPPNDCMGAFTQLLAVLPPEIGQDELRLMRRMIAEQFMRLVDTVYRLPPMDGEDMSVEQYLSEFDTAVKNVRALHTRWSAQKSCYVRGDGSVLVSEVIPVYPRAEFTPHFSGDSECHFDLNVQRANAWRVHVGVGLHAPNGREAEFHVRVIRLGKTEELIEEFTSPSRSNPYNQSSGAGLNIEPRLSPGQTIRVELIVGKEKFATPAIVP